MDALPERPSTTAVHSHTFCPDCTYAPAIPSPSPFQVGCPTLLPTLVPVLAGGCHMLLSRHNNVLCDALTRWCMLNVRTPFRIFTKIDVYCNLTRVWPPNAPSMCTLASDWAISYTSLIYCLFMKTLTLILLMACYSAKSDGGYPTYRWSVVAWRTKSNHGT